LRTRYWTSELEGVGELRQRSGFGGRGHCTAEGAVAHRIELRLAPCQVGSPSWGERRVATGKGGGIRTTPTYPPQLPFSAMKLLQQNLVADYKFVPVITTHCYCITGGPVEVALLQITLALLHHYCTITTALLQITLPLLHHYCIITAPLQHHYYRLLQIYCILQLHYCILLHEYFMNTTDYYAIIARLQRHYYLLLPFTAQLLHHYNIITTNYCVITAQLQMHYYRLLWNYYTITSTLHYHYYILLHHYFAIPLPLLHITTALLHQYLSLLP
jgi:hypothetical protein